MDDFLLTDKLFLEWVRRLLVKKVWSQTQGRVYGMTVLDNVCSFTMTILHNDITDAIFIRTMQNNGRPFYSNNAT